MSDGTAALIALLTAAGAFLLGTAALAKGFHDRPGSKAAAVKALSEARLSDAQAQRQINDDLRQQILDAKGDIGRLRVDLNKSVVKSDQLSEQNGTYKRTISDLRDRLDILESDLQDAREQEKQLVKQLDEAHKQVKLLLQQRDILIEHIRTVEKWHSGGQLGDMPALKPLD